MLRCSSAFLPLLLLQLMFFFNILFLAGNDQPPANSNASPAHSASAERSPTGSASPAHRPPSNEKTVDNW